MNPDETADNSVMVAEGQQPGEGLSATPEVQQPNTPENEAGSGVQPQELPVSDSQGNGDQAGVAAPQEDPEQVVATLTKQGLKQKTGEQMQKFISEAKSAKAEAEALRRQKEMLEDMVRQSGLQPTVGIPKPPLEAPATPITPAVVPSLSEGAQAQIAQQEAYWQQLHTAWNNTPEGDPNKAQLAALANQTYKQMKALERQDIVREAAMQMQSLQSHQARNAQFYGEVNEVNSELHPELRFIDGNGQIMADSNTWKAMANLAYTRFGLSPQQLATTPDVLAYTANAMLRRVNGAASQAAFTKTKQLETKQKMLKKQVGLETSGAAAAPEPPGTNRRVKELMQKRKAGTITRPELLELGSHLV